MPKHVLLVFSDPVAGRDDEYNAWYDQTHLKEVLQVEGFVGAQRFKVSDVMPGVTSHAYLAVYDIEADDPAAAMQALQGAIPGMQMSDAFDAANAKIALVTALSDLLRA